MTQTTNIERPHSARTTGTVCFLRVRSLRRHVLWSRGLVGTSRSDAYWVFRAHISVSRWAALLSFARLRIFPTPPKPHKTSDTSCLCVQGCSECTFAVAIDFRRTLFFGKVESTYLVSIFGNRSCPRAANRTRVSASPPRVP